MINTIDECDQELIRIDFEFNRLELERNHILKVRKFLEHQPTIRFKTPLTQRILEIVTANPGLNAITIREALNDETIPTRKVSFTLANLSKSGRVENRGSRGGRGRMAKWYAKEAS